LEQVSVEREGERGSVMSCDSLDSLGVKFGDGGTMERRSEEGRDIHSLPLDKSMCIRGA
jgi:hypothetical protein